MKSRIIFLLAFVALLPVLRADAVVHEEHTVNGFTPKAQKVVLTYSEDELKENYRKFKASGHGAISEEAARAKAQKAIDVLIAGEKWKVLGQGVHNARGIPLYRFACNHLGPKGQSSYEFVSVLVLLDGTVLAPKPTD